MKKNLGRMAGLRLGAIILAVILISPGALWSQGARPGTQVKDSPRQADKSFILEQQKKRPRLRNPKKLYRSNRKKQSRPPTSTKKPIRRIQ